MTDYLLTAGFFGLGFFFQSIFGFGGSFIIVLGLSLFIPIQPVIGMIPLSLLAGITVSVVQDRKTLPWKPVVKMFLLSVPGAALGALMLNRVSSQIIIICVCILILLWTVLSLTRDKIVIPPVIKIPMILLSGFVIGATGMGITFVPLIMEEMDDPADLRKSLNFMWFLQGLLRLPIYFASGVITGEYALMALSVIPVLLLALAGGTALHRRIHPDRFRSMVLISLALLVLARLVSEIV